MTRTLSPPRAIRPVAWISTSLLVPALLLLSPLEVLAQENAAAVALAQAEQVTFSDHVAPIINANCVVCHQAGAIGPMELTTYDQVKQWAPVIADRVAKGEMPPYAYDRDIGVQELLHDWRLTPEEINTIVRWAKNGAPVGDADRIPAPVLGTSDEWNFAAEYGPPDVIIPSRPIDVPADGNDMWDRPFVPTGITEDRCIKAVQVKPAGDAKTVVHHANSEFAFLNDNGELEEGARLTEYAMGKVGEVIPEGVCRIAPADSYVLWNIHLYPGGIGKTAVGGVVEDNIIEIGIWFHPEDYEYEYRQTLRQYGMDQSDILIPPHGTFMTQGYHTFDHPVRIDSFQPHGHLRLRHASMEILYPETGETVPVSMISNWSAQWHHSHIYHPDHAPLLPTGAVMILRQWYDNTADNPNNPDPDLWVDGGSRTADEMRHAWISVTHLDEEGYQKLLAEREQKQQQELATADPDAHNH